MSTSCAGLRALRTWVAVAAAGGLVACANTVTASPPLKTLIFKITTRGQIRSAQEIRYILAIDANGNPNDGPRPYGPWARENPILGWDQPFYLIPETQVPPQFFNPPIVQNNTWTDLFIYTAAAGQPVIQHWVQVPDPQLVRKFEARPDLVPGQEYRLTNSNLPSGGIPVPGTPTGVTDTLELTLVLNRYITNEDFLKSLKQLEANLVIQTRPPDNARDYIPGGWKVDQWFNNDTDIFAIPLDKDRPADRKDALDLAPLYPQNKPAGFADDEVTFKSYSTEFKETAGQ